ncbi:P-loop NTPase fold protein [Pseudomonas japonica]|uniref:P-loop NTPase fold protein n=1 Tax=Pseudomonas japonica TaxID=256466 RepID=UPI0015E36839|nr:P-loop NTPase fold protein [Pseudomonas japonica]MBA1245472.1 hypothetical protein [Pseudomonas japonica]
MNSYEIAKSTLIEILNKDNYKVIALSGKWGTGKTHLWSTAEKSITLNSSTPAPIYFSIFGAKSLNDMKFRLLQCRTISKDSKFKEIFGAGGSAIKGIAGKFIPGLAVDDLALLWLPKLLAKRLIVIDDIERKHKNLDIDEVLGFINEYSENHDARFLLLLNSDNLEDEAIWRKLHEKVVDIEIVLKPNSEEAYDIAAADFKLPYTNQIKSVVASLGITNIRIIKRILRVFSELASPYGMLDEHIIDSIVGSTALLTAIHYRGISSKITMEYVLQYNSFQSIFSRKERSAEEQDWDNILEKLKIASADDYEEIVVSYLRSGIIDRSRLDKVIEKYREQFARNEIYDDFRSLFEAYSWDPDFIFDINSESIERLRKNANLLSASDASSLSMLFTQCGHPETADSLIQSWIDQNEAVIESGASEHFSSEDFSHPALAALDARIRNNRFPPLTLVEALQRIRNNNGWGDRENICLSESTPKMYEATIRSLRGKELANFLNENFSIMRISNPEPAFSHALENFKYACKNIVDSDPDSRLSEILIRVFHSNNVALE